MRGAEKDNSSALWKRPCPSPSVCPGADTAADLDTCLDNFPNSRHFVNGDFTASTYPLHPTLHTFNPVEVIYPAYTSKEIKKYQHDSPNGLPHDQRRLYSPASTNGQAHPNQRNISSTFNASFQEKVTNEVPLQDRKRQIYADKRYQNYAISTLW